MSCVWLIIINYASTQNLFHMSKRTFSKAALKNLLKEVQPPNMRFESQCIDFLVDTMEGLFSFLLLLSSFFSFHSRTCNRSPEGMRFCFISKKVYYNAKYQAYWSSSRSFFFLFFFISYSFIVGTQSRFFYSSFITNSKGCYFLQFMLSYFPFSSSIVPLQANKRLSTHKRI